MITVTNNYFADRTAAIAAGLFPANSKPKKYDLYAAINAHNLLDESARRDLTGVNGSPAMFAAEERLGMTLEDLAPAAEVAPAEEVEAPAAPAEEPAAELSELDQLKAEFNAANQEYQFGFANGDLRGQQNAAKRRAAAAKKIGKLKREQRSAQPVEVAEEPAAEVAPAEPAEEVETVEITAEEQQRRALSGMYGIAAKQAIEERHMMAEGYEWVETDRFDKPEGVEFCYQAEGFGDWLRKAQTTPNAKFPGEQETGFVLYELRKPEPAEEPAAEVEAPAAPFEVGDRVRRDTSDRHYQRMIGEVVEVDLEQQRARVRWEANRTWYAFSKLIKVSAEAAAPAEPQAKKSLEGYEPPAASRPLKPGSKAEQEINLLRNGATQAEMMQALGWSRWHWKFSAALNHGYGIRRDSEGRCFLVTPDSAAKNEA